VVDQDDAIAVEFPGAVDLFEVDVEDRLERPVLLVAYLAGVVERRCRVDGFREFADGQRRRHRVRVRIRVHQHRDLVVVGERIAKGLCRRRTQIAHEPAEPRQHEYQRDEDGGDLQR